MTTDDTIQFTAVGYDANNNVNASITISWAISGGGIIDDTGYFEPYRVGSWVVYANCSSISGTAVVNVTHGDLNKIEVIPNFARVKLGSAMQFNATGYDADNNMFPILVVWEVVPSSLGRFEADGRFHATGVGKGQIIASYHVITGSAEIVVVPIGTELTVILPERPIVSRTVELRAEILSGPEVKSMTFYWLDSLHQRGKIDVDNNGDDGWAVQWDTTIVEDGPYKIVVNATNKYDVYSEAISDTITVNNGFYIKLTIRGAGVEILIESYELKGSGKVSRLGIYDGILYQEFGYVDLRTDTLKSYTIYNPPSDLTYLIFVNRSLGGQPVQYHLIIEWYRRDAYAKVTAENISLEEKETHSYRIDWETVRMGAAGVVVAVDENGDGKIDYEVKTGGVITDAVLQRPVRGKVEFPIYIIIIIIIVVICIIVAIALSVRRARRKLRGRPPIREVAVAPTPPPILRKMKRVKPRRKVPPRAKVAKVRKPPKPKEEEEEWLDI
jgi:hypothetical protein